MYRESRTVQPCSSSILRGTLVNPGIRKYQRIARERKSFLVLAIIFSCVSMQIRSRLSYIHEDMLSICAPIPRLNSLTFTTFRVRSRGMMKSNDSGCPPETPLPITQSQWSRTKDPGRRPWSQKDDERLIQIVALVGTKDWNKVAWLMGNRSRAQCAQRWFRTLDPTISKAAWSSEEDDLLRKLVAENKPHHWIAISREMKTRSDLQCRHRYMTWYEPSQTGAHEEAVDRAVPHK
jgi:hypothetical protein